MLKSLPLKSNNILNLLCCIYWLLDKYSISVITDLNRHPQMCVEMRDRGGGGVYRTTLFRSRKEMGDGGGGVSGGGGVTD